jgi:hypothetical protein
MKRQAGTEDQCDLLAQDGKLVRAKPSDAVYVCLPFAHDGYLLQ